MRKFNFKEMPFIIATKNMTTKNKSNKTYTGPITEQLLKLH